jgi:hypothetical protein
MVPSEAEVVSRDDNDFVASVPPPPPPPPSSRTGRRRHLPYHMVSTVHLVIVEEVTTRKAKGAEAAREGQSERSNEINSPKIHDDVEHKRREKISFYVGINMQMYLSILHSPSIEAEPLP